MSWDRPHLQPGGRDAHLHLQVHGDFAPLVVSRERHRCEGLPDGLTLTRYARDTPASRFGTEPPLRAALDALPDDRVRAVLDAPTCVVLRGVVRTPDTLAYLRDAVGLAQALLDTGGVAVFDPYRLTWWDGPAWTTQIFDPDGPVPLQHAVILDSPEPDGTTWLHTRGMIKFGRPDVSIHAVPTALRDAAIDLCERLITFQALGAVIPDGQAIRVAGLPPWRCHTVGSMDDPDFNNVHLSIGRESP